MLRVVAVALAASAGVGLAPQSARADDGPIVVRGDGRRIVDTRVTDPGQRGSAAPAGQPVARGGSAIPCRYYKRYYSPSLPGGRTVDLGGASGSPGGRGQWWLRVCSDFSAELVFVRDGRDPNAAAATTPAVLAIRAYNRLVLPSPRPAFNPARPSSAGPATTAHLPTWWWVTDWGTRRQRTAAGGVWAEVTARPLDSEWDPGDGGPPVSCAGPGERWTPTAAGNCSSVYESSSATEPGHVFRASVTVTWQVTWVGAGGAAGRLPALTTTAAFPVAVQERESVVVGSGGGR